MASIAVFQGKLGAGNQETVGGVVVIKWKLMLSTIPAVMIVIALRLVVTQVLGAHGWLDFSDVAPVLTAGAFLIGFMLSGTMSDFKESEKLPGELASTLETLEDLMTVSEIKKDFDTRGARKALLRFTDSCLDWLAKKQPVTAVYAAIDGLNPHYQKMDASGATAHANRSLVFINTVRRIICRMDVISKTGFLESGYAILDAIVGAIVVLMLVAKFKSVVAEYTLLTFITLVYVYMARLIRDLDDPFEYGADLKRRGAAEVDLFPLIEYRERAKARLDALGPGQ